MVKCTLCKEQIAELFLKKLKGTIIKKPSSSKQHPVCFSCQKKYRSKEKMLEAME